MNHATNLAMGGKLDNGFKACCCATALAQ